MSETQASTLEQNVRRVPAGRWGMWWFLAGEVLIFGGAIVSYVLYRIAHSEWAQEAAHTWTTIGAVNTFVLLTSSLFVVLAHQAATEKKFDRAAKHLWVTIGLGLLFLVFKAIEYSREIHHGFTPLTNLFWSFYFFLTGLHALHVTAGLVALGIVAEATRRGKNPQRVEYAGLYWHLVDIIWIFLFPLLYVVS